MNSAFNEIKEFPNSHLQVFSLEASFMSINQTILQKSSELTRFCLRKLTSGLVIIYIKRCKQISYDRLNRRLSPHLTNINPRKASISMLAIAGVCLSVVIIACFPSEGYAKQIVRSKSIRLVSYSRIVDAIYRAEGGHKAQYLYGIRSVSYRSPAHARQICLNTVRNNYRRWKAQGARGSYLEFLASRYAPRNVSNDPYQLNRHWLNNVRSFL